MALEDDVAKRVAQVNTQRLNERETKDKGVTACIGFFKQTAGPAIMDLAEAFKANGHPAEVLVGELSASLKVSGPVSLEYSIDRVRGNLVRARQTVRDASGKGTNRYRRLVPGIPSDEVSASAVGRQMVIDDVLAAYGT